jgi:hypothetical protein
MTSTASTTSVASMASLASFHQKNYTPWHKYDLFWSLNVWWIIKNSLIYWFLAPFLLEAVEDREVTFNQIEGS